MGSDSIVPSEGGMGFISGAQKEGGTSRRLTKGRHVDKIGSFRAIMEAITQSAGGLIFGFPIIGSKQIQNSTKFPMKMELF